MPSSRSELIERTQKEVIRGAKRTDRSTKEIEEQLLEFYKESQDEIKRIILELAEKMSEWSMVEAQKWNRYNKLAEQIKEECYKLGEREIEYLQQSLEGLYTDSYLHSVYALGQSTNVKINLTSINTKRIKEIVNYPWSGDMFSSRVWDNKGKLVQNIRQGLTQSLILGEGIPEMSRRITETIDSSYSDAQRVARSECKRISYVARAKTFEENGVERVEFWATVPSERTCDECGKYHQKPYDLGEEPAIPVHPNCRCEYLPIVVPIWENNKLNELAQKIRKSPNFEEFKEKVARPYIERAA